MLLEAIVNALRAMRSNKMRTLLTCLGNIIAVAALVLVVALVQGLNAEVRRALLARGADTFFVERYGQPRSEEEWERVYRRPPVTPGDAEAIRRGSTLAAHVLTQWNFRAPLRTPGQSVEAVDVQARSNEYPHFLDETIDVGRYFTETEDRRASPVVILGSDVADALFPGEAALGRTVRIADRHFDVIGVMKARGAILGQSQDKYAIIPFGTARQEWGRPWNVTVAVKPVSPEAMDACADEARAALRAHRRMRPSHEDTFDLLAAAQYVRMYEESTRAITGAFIGLVGLALVVGGIVIWNVMLMVVTQRTREIGIRKAVGARRGQILAQFLVESAMLSLLGGLIGFALGAGGTAVGRWLTPVPFRIEAWSVLVGLAMVIVVGVAAGLFPAVRAARMDPIAALRYER